MTDSKFIDSSVWIDYLYNGKWREVIESEKIILTSSLSIFEIKKKIAVSKQKEDEIKKIIEFIKKRSLIIPIDDSIAEEAAELSIKNKLGAIDSLIYTSAIKNNSELITLDNDFRGLEKAKILN